MSKDEIPSGRLASLDAFRGLTIAGMILVNTPGNWGYVYPPMRHAAWHGWTPTDLVFPFFLFIVGVSISLSFARRIESGANARAMHLKVVRRTLLIFGIGLFLNAFPRFDFGTLRFLGVLQRIALVYLLTSLIVLRTDRRGRMIWTGGILLFYWGLMMLIPVPGYGAGDLSAEGSLASFVDRLILGGHTYRPAYDPEGLLSTLPAVSTALLGVFTGDLLRSRREPAKIANLLFVSGWAAILAGQFWGSFFPINKPLWTSSYVLFTAGAALELLALSYWLIDMKGYRRWARPAIAFGMNPLSIFVLSILLVKITSMIRVGIPSGGAPGGGTTSVYYWAYRFLFVPILGPLNGSLGFAIAFMLLCYLVAEILYRRRLFIRV
jgi:predicted acyltransferase